MELIKITYSETQTQRIHTTMYIDFTLYAVFHLSGNDFL